MKKSFGFTLVEILIVLSIISILTIIGVANFRDFAEQQVIIKAADQIQTLLRLAHRNASSSVKCTDTQDAVSWLVDFKETAADPNHRTITLSCKSTTSTTLIKTMVLDSNIEISRIITTSACTATEFPTYSATLIYSAPLGKVDFVMARGVTGGPAGNFECYPATRTVTVRLTDNKTSKTKDITISKGGEIDVQ